MSDHDDRLDRLEAKVDELARRIDDLGSGAAASGAAATEFDAENDTNRFPPKSEF